jgi:hypothetical protein
VVFWTLLALLSHLHHLHIIPLPLCPLRILHLHLLSRYVLLRFVHSSYPAEGHEPFLWLRFELGSLGPICFRYSWTWWSLFYASTTQRLELLESVYLCAQQCHNARTTQVLHYLPACCRFVYTSENISIFVWRKCKSCSVSVKCLYHGSMSQQRRTGPVAEVCRYILRHLRHFVLFQGVRDSGPRPTLVLVHACAQQMYQELSGIIANEAWDTSDAVLALSPRALPVATS